MRLLIVFILAIPVLFFSSCRTQNKLPRNYLENVNDTIGKDALRIIEPRIQKNDLLSIQVYSAATDPMVDAPYNLPNFTTSTQGGRSVTGLLVDANGNIEYPRLGTIHVEGLTKQEVSDIIKSKLVGQLTNPSVVVRFLNYRITVIGEVARPGTFDIPNERVTILEALGLAGDIPVTGKRNNVKVIREANGNREIGTLDLTSKDFFESPYYVLQQNDVVIVEPTKAKLKQQTDQVTQQRISLALSLITSIALLYNLFR
jgi:polysaccharide biosynthesis/export protein